MVTRTTEIERLKKRISDSLKKIERDTNKLFAIVEERGELIDTLARENEQYATLEEDYED